MAVRAEEKDTNVSVIGNNKDFNFVTFNCEFIFMVMLFKEMFEKKSLKFAKLHIIWYERLNVCMRISLYNERV